MIAILCLIPIALLSQAANAAQCQGPDGKWYDYSSPQCSTGRAVTDTAAPQRATSHRAESWDDAMPDAKSRCAARYDSYTLINICMRNERKGFALFHGSDYGMPHSAAAGAKSRCAKRYPDYTLRNICMRNESQGFAKVFGK